MTYKLIFLIVLGFVLQAANTQGYARGNSNPNNTPLESSGEKIDHEDKKEDDDDDDDHDDDDDNDDDDDEDDDDDDDDDDKKEEDDDDDDDNDDDDDDDDEQKRTTTTTTTDHYMQSTTGAYTEEQSTSDNYEQATTSEHTDGVFTTTEQLASTTAACTEEQSTSDNYEQATTSEHTDGVFTTTEQLASTSTPGEFSTTHEYSTPIYSTTGIPGVIDGTGVKVDGLVTMDGEKLTWTLDLANQNSDEFKEKEHLLCIKACSVTNSMLVFILQLRVHIKPVYVFHKCFRLTVAPTSTTEVTELPGTFSTTEVDVSTTAAMDTTITPEPPTEEHTST